MIDQEQPHVTGNIEKRMALSVLVLLRAVVVMSADVQSACCVQVLIHPLGLAGLSSEVGGSAGLKARLRALENLVQGHIASY